MIFVLVTFLSSLLIGMISASNPLGPYLVSDVTVSGVSSGGYMAVQMHIAYSSIVNGSAIFAGGPFYCAQDNIMTAEYSCMQTYQGAPNVNQLITITKQYETNGQIDQLSNLADDRVFLFSGTADTVVVPAVVKSLQTYYSSFLTTTNIITNFNFNAEHCWPTPSYGEACTTLASPYLGKCALDGGGIALQTLYGNNLNAAVTAISSNLMQFSQTPYITSSTSSLASTGYIYVPTSCQAGKECHLHVAFHGCKQTQDMIGNQFAADAHLNEWAESNNVIVLYPYAKVSQSTPSNPNGCWDWWGYTDKNYAIQIGQQMSFVRSLIKAVSGK